MIDDSGLIIFPLVFLLNYNIKLYRRELSMKFKIHFRRFIEEDDDSKIGNIIYILNLKKKFFITCFSVPVMVSCLNLHEIRVLFSIAIVN